jgi:tRNA(Ile)-lysidine synthase TilS/MesJ
LEFGYDETNADPKFKRNAIRQQIQNWSMRLFIFAKIITKINRKKNRFNNTVDRYFRGWQRNEYDIERFRNFPKKYHSSIIYHFLNSLNVDVSANKINGLIEFIFNSDGNDKEYRLSDNVGIRFGR